MKKGFLVTAAMLFVALSLPCGVKADSTGVKEGVVVAFSIAALIYFVLTCVIKQGGKEVGTAFKEGS